MLPVHSLNTISCMEIRGKLLPTEIKEAGGFLRSKWYWPKLLLRSWYGGLLFIALLWGTIAKAVSGDRTHWVGLSIVWLVVAAIFVWSFSSTRRSQRRAAQALNVSLPDKLIIGDEGVTTRSDDGRTSFLPWTSFTHWRGGVSVSILKLIGPGSFLLIPLSNLTDADRGRLQATLLQRLGSPQEKGFV